MGSLACVVVLNWNGRAYLRDCLRSLDAQTYDDRRVLVVDNASTDGSADLVTDEFPEVALVRNPENVHFARGMNTGFAHALEDPRTAFVVALNNDVRVDPEWLAALVAAVGAPQVGMAASKLLFMDRPTILNSTGLRPAPDGSGIDRGWNEPDEGQYDDRADVFGPSGGAALYRREVLDSVGLFDTDFVAYGEDLDLAFRARFRGWTARFAPRAVVYHKYSASIGARSEWKTFMGERNRIWTLVQNYPWGLAARGACWNVARLVAAQRRQLRVREGATPTGGQGDGSVARATARARLAAYAGLGHALRKRRERFAARTVAMAEVGRWLRDYGATIRDLVEA